jgi:hypothetical protein
MISKKCKAALQIREHFNPHDFFYILAQLCLRYHLTKLFCHLQIKTLHEILLSING